jgi:hypothetical protein
VTDRFDRQLLFRTSAIVAGVLVVVTAAWFASYLNGYTLPEQAQSVATAKDLLEIAAVIVGALWTIRTYVVARTEREAVIVDQSVTALRLPDNRYLLRVFVTLRNIGKVKVDLQTWRLRADLLLPLSPPTKTLLDSRSAFSEREAGWITLTNARQGTFGAADFAISVEPGESELQIGNLVVPEWAEVVQVYSHFERSGTGALEGWSQRSVVDLKRGNPNVDH